MKLRKNQLLTEEGKRRYILCLQSSCEVWWHWPELIIAECFVHVGESVIILCKTLCCLSEDELCLCSLMVFRDTFGLSSSLLTDVCVALMIQLPVNHHRGIEGLEIKANRAICHFYHKDSYPHTQKESCLSNTAAPVFVPKCNYRSAETFILFKTK